MNLRRIKAVVSAIALATTLMAQPNYSNTRQQETLDRGIVAFNTANNTTFISWRYFDHESGYKYQLFRNGEKMVETQRTSHTLPIESAPTDKYQVKVVNREGTVVETSKEVMPYAEALKIKLEKPANRTSGQSYAANDISVGDVDGDGQYELILKWDPTNSQDNSKSGKTDDVYLDCYRLDGTRLWRLSLGPNIRAGAHYTQFLVYDFDGDGKAEVMCKTAPWSADANGKFVNQAADDAAIKAYGNTTSYRNGNGHVLTGPEFLTVFNGLTGEAIHTVWYNPNRAMTFNQEGEYTSAWGDNYGNRSERYNACVAYLDGEKPSAVFCRGYYTQAFLWAVDFDGAKLKHRWLHASVSNSRVEHYDASWNKTERTYDSNTCGMGPHYTAYGNGNHNLSVGDYDGDGRDEITLGSCAIDDDGQLLYAVGFGHGDAIHVGDLDPDRPGLEVFHVHEETITGNNYGWDLHDAKTGEVIWSAAGAEDNGRGIAADIFAANRGAEFASSNDRDHRSAATGKVVSTKHASCNFRAYWDGTLQDNLLDGGYSEAYTITRWNGSSFESVTGLEGSSCNTTKRTPNLSADIFGDWREEIILHDDSNLYIYSSAMPTAYNVPCLMTDHIYRMGIAWQQSSYNQPPHLGYYLPDHALDMSTAEETLYYDPAELVNQGVQHIEVGSGDIHWTLATADLSEQAVIAEGISPYFTGNSITLGSTLKVYGERTVGETTTSTQTLFYPDIADKEKDGTATDGNAVTFSVTLKEGYEFIPTAVNFYTTRYGTDGGSVDVNWLNGDGTNKKIATGISPARNNATPPYTAAEYTLNAYKATSGTFGVRFNLYGITNNKQLGLGDIIISGRVLSLSSEGIAEGIHDIRDTGTNTAAPYYTIDGRRMRTQPAQPGIYIHHGKKVVVK